ncbi:putative glucose-6-phosphate 1-epimerase isoform X2 [Asparagus officinalis]|uniref:putative glucose-6-phosphate 1-epimerase isoform X2 n=1 Tax=Asparagus officinalis TaxID=4686 RepID=UPI00098E74BB|nr:putative glucose-6-phosphate 1-epimerase isoform X2 [Asparagus officinalis]
MASSVSMLSSSSSCSPLGDSLRARAGLNQQKTAAALGVKISEGNGGLPKVSLTSSRGSEAEIYLFGGCITSWKLANGKDLLFVRPDAVFNGNKPISGGIPHCFPQFGPGPIQQHGFGRNMNWSLADSENSEGDPTVTLELKDDNYSRSMWDFSFHASYRASVTGASVKGLKGCTTLNKDPDPSNPLEGKEEREVINFPGFVDCVYLNAPNELLLDNGLGDVITIKNKNWTDAVLWNPHLQMEACYKDFVCVENAKIGKVQLDPEQSWVAEQHISAS